MTSRLRFVPAVVSLSLLACATDDGAAPEENVSVEQAATTAPAPLGPGEVAFDSFAGTTTDDKIRSLNAWAKSAGSTGSRPAVVFDARRYAHSVPIELWTGLTLVGGRRSAAREFNTGTVLHYQGAPGTSQFAFVPNVQSYPGEGSPRDMSFRAIQFSAHIDVHHMPKHDPAGGGYQGKTLWYVNWHDCGWMGFATIWWGWGDGVTISGISHLQAVADTAFYIGGSENHLFEGYSFIDNGTPSWMSSGKPFLRSRMEKSSIGKIMMSARGNSSMISVEGGRNLVIDGTAFDSPDSQPTLGRAVTISGGSGIRITNTSFKGVMTNPAGATGGAAANRGIIHVTGGSQIVIDGNNFQSTAPFVWVGPNVGANQVKLGLNGAVNNGDPRVLQAKTGQILNLDPTVDVLLAP